MCCCKTKPQVAKASSQSCHKSGNGIENDGGCKAVAYFGVVPAISAVAVDASASDSVFAAMLNAGAATIAAANHAFVTAELNTGPPPDSLVVVLHRWVI